MHRLSTLLRLGFHNNALSGTLPKGLFMAESLWLLVLEGNDLAGSIPDGIASLLALSDFVCDENMLTGPLPSSMCATQSLQHLSACDNCIQGALPDGIGCWSALQTIFLYSRFEGCGLSGPLPATISAARSLDTVSLQDNFIRGTLPDGVGCSPALKVLILRKNWISGALPGALHVAQSLSIVSAEENERITGALPHAIGVRSLDTLLASWNHLQGALPDGLGFLSVMKIMHLMCNDGLSGRLPDTMYGMRSLQTLEIFRNSCTGTLPGALVTWRDLDVLDVEQNQLSGLLPHGLPTLTKLSHMILSRNQFSGPISTCAKCNFVCLVDNSFTGTVPEATLWSGLEHLQLSGNLLEGAIPVAHPWATGGLKSFAVGGRSHGPVCGLRGPLPESLPRALVLKWLVAPHNQLRGSVPSLQATMRALTLYHTELRSLAEVPKADYIASSYVLLHHNMLSCHVPDREVAYTICTVALGNWFQKSDGPLPSWIEPAEKDGLFWLSGTEVSFLCLKIIAAVTLLVTSISGVHGLFGCISAFQSWRTAPYGQSLLKVALYLLTCFVQRVPGCVVLLMLLLHWPAYACPRSLALASACRTGGALAKCMVLVLWAQLLRQVLTGCQGVTRSIKRSRARPTLAWVTWILLTTPLAAPVIVTMVGRSIPDFLGIHGIWLSAVSATVGLAQGLVTSVVIPVLAEKCTPDAHAFSSMSNLIQALWLPALCTMYLNTNCLGRWVLSWHHCSGSAYFDNLDILYLGESFRGMSLRMVNKREVCGVTTGESLIACLRSMWSDMHDLLLGKLVSLALLVPAGTLATGRYAKKPREVLTRLESLLQLALLASGHLPLLTPLLCAATLVEVLMAAVAREKGVLKLTGADLMATSSVFLGLALSVVLQLCFASEDWLLFALFVAALLAMPRPILKQPVPRWQSKPGTRAKT